MQSSTNDLYMFDPITMTWTRLSNTANSNPPRERAVHGFTQEGDKLYLYGGFPAGAYVSSFCTQ